MSNMIFLAVAMLGWSEIVRRLDLKERTLGVGDGEINGYRYSIIRREDRLYIVLPDYQPREECEETVKNILNTLKPEAKIEVVKMGFASSRCNYCLDPTTYPYKCMRCGGWYCRDHRLPEEHNCPRSDLVKANHNAEIKEREKGNRKHLREMKVVAVEIPCG